MDVPIITNLRLDPFERTGWPNDGTKEGAQQYFDWFKYQFWRFVFVQQVMGKEIQTFLDYPPMQTRRELQPRCPESRDGGKDGRGGKGEQRRQRIIWNNLHGGRLERAARRIRNLSNIAPE